MQRETFAGFGVGNFKVRLPARLCLCARETEAWAGCGGGTVQALFEAIEREQALRGNL